MKSGSLKYHHLGIPTRIHREGEEYLPEYKIFHSGYETSEYGIEWMYYGDGCQLPEIVRTMPHIAFEVEDLREAIKGKRVIIEPNSPSPGNWVAFIEEDGVPIEFIQVGGAEPKQLSAMDGRPEQKERFPRSRRKCK